MWSTKGITTIGKINAKPLYEPGRLKCRIEEINLYRWDVLGISETHWVGEGEMMSEGIKIIYSGRRDIQHREGVALLLGKRVQSSYKEHKAVNSRIISVTFQGRHRDSKIIQIYTPDSSQEDEDVEEFYENLEEELRCKKDGDVVMVIEDFNSKVGRDNSGFEDIMGRF